MIKILPSTRPVVPLAGLAAMALLTGACAHQPAVACLSSPPALSASAAAHPPSHLASSAAAAYQVVRPPGAFAGLGRELAGLVRDHFFNAGQATAWFARHQDYASGAVTAQEFTERTNQVLAELRASHTHYYTPLGTGYYALRSIFQQALKIEPALVEGIGADIAQLPTGSFVREVFIGGPAAPAGLLRGDRLVAVNGRPFDPNLPFQGLSGKEIKLEIERRPGQRLTVQITPRQIEPQKEWLEAQRQGARIIERSGRKIAYVHLFSCAGDQYREALQDSIVESFGPADALVLDFRDGWGGCNPDFVSIFDQAVPALTSIDREGKSQGYDPQWRKRLVLLVNGGSRSGKEVAAFAIKKRKLGTLVGERTAGALLAGRVFLLSDKSLLYLAVSDGRVDGVRLEGVGVEPDVPVTDLLSYAEGRDPQLEKALEVAAGK